MGFMRFMGFEGKPKIMVFCAIAILVINILFVAYSALYTIPDAALEKQCKQLMINDCDFTQEVSDYCYMQEHDNLLDGE